jgi:uncharacterized protein
MKQPPGSELAVPETAPGCPRVDVHCHVGQRHRCCGDEGRFSFEPPGGYAPCDAYFSDVMYGGMAFRLARWYFELPRSRPETATQLDDTIERVLLQHIVGATRIDRVVVVAFDQYHTFDGQALGQRRHRWQVGSDLYVSNTYVRQLWRRHPERILFGASIHPYRQQGGMSATDMLDEVVKAGAVLIKWLPLAQNIDAEDPRTVAFLRRAADLRMPVLIHCGAEAALGNLHPHFKDPAPLLRSLSRLRDEGHMPTVIVAHAASPPLWPVTPAGTLWTLLGALKGEFAGAPLYTDVAGLTMFNKAIWLKRLAHMPEIHHKLVQGSDFPIPPIPLMFRRQLGGRYDEVRGMTSWLDRDVAIKQALGLPESVLTRGGELLAERIRYADSLRSQT